jgi:hypothetical protein
VKKNMPKIVGFQSFKTARRTIAGFEAMLWLRRALGFAGDWTVNDHNDLLARLFGLQKVKNENATAHGIATTYRIVCDKPVSGAC